MKRVYVDNLTESTTAANLRTALEAHGPEGRPSPVY